MKLSHPALDTVFSTEEGYVPAITIENRSFLRNFIQDLNGQAEGKTGEAVLSYKENILDMSKNMEIIDNFLTFTLNRKSLLNKIASALEKTSMNESMYLKSAEIISLLEQYMEQLADGFDCDLDFSKISVPSIIKAAGITIRDEYANPLEQIIDYMELVREFDRDKLFVFVNMRSYYSEEEMIPFYRTALDHGFNMFMIDSFDVNKVDAERRLIIDQDLCEI